MAVTEGKAPAPSAASQPELNAYRSALRVMRRPVAAAGFFSALISLLMLTGSLYMLQVYDRVLSSGSVATLQGLFVIVTLAYAFYGLYEFLRAHPVACRHAAGRGRWPRWPSRLAEIGPSGRAGASPADARP